MNPKDIVYKMVVLGRRLTTHFILDIFWGSSFMFHARAQEMLSINGTLLSMSGKWYLKKEYLH